MSLPVWSHDPSRGNDVTSCLVPCSLQGPGGMGPGRYGLREEVWSQRGAMVPERGIWSQEGMVPGRGEMVSGYGIPYPSQY